MGSFQNSLSPEEPPVGDHQSNTSSPELNTKVHILSCFCGINQCWNLFDDPYAQKYGKDYNAMTIWRQWWQWWWRQRQSGGLGVESIRWRDKAGSDGSHSVNTILMPFPLSHEKYKNCEEKNNWAQIYIWLKVQKVKFRFFLVTASLSHTIPWKLNTKTYTHISSRNKDKNIAKSYRLNWLLWLEKSSSITLTHLDSCVSIVS